MTDAVSWNSSPSGSNSRLSNKSRNDDRCFLCCLLAASPPNRGRRCRCCRPSRPPPKPPSGTDWYLRWCCCCSPPAVISSLLLLLSLPAPLPPSPASPSSTLDNNPLPTVGLGVGVVPCPGCDSPPVGAAVPCISLSCSVLLFILWCLLCASFLCLLCLEFFCVFLCSILFFAAAAAPSVGCYYCYCIYWLHGFPLVCVCVCVSKCVYTHVLFARGCEFFCFLLWLFAHDRVFWVSAILPRSVEKKIPSLYFLSTTTCSHNHHDFDPSIHVL